jgi:hypothetical protein
VERGPMALFGAIIAIGLGPAMWLGAQFGQVTLSPDRPPAVTSVNQDAEAPRGGSGAGDAPTDSEAIRTEPKSNNKPLDRTRNARPVVTKSPSPSPSTSDKPSTPPVESGTPTSPDTGGEESDPPTDPTTPQDPPPDDDGEPDVPPQPPADPQSGPAAGDDSLT